MTSNWYTYPANDGSYTIKFPSKPQENNKFLNTPQGNVKYVFASYQDRVNNRIYGTTSINYPFNPKNFDVEKGLDAGRDGAAKNSNSTITSEKKISYKGYPGREITIRGKNNITGKVRVFIDPKGLKLYQTVVFIKNGNLNSPEIIAFLDSFTIK